MNEMEEKLGAILNNPQLMQTIFSMAQNLGQEASGGPDPAPEPAADLPEIDFSLLRKFSGLAGQSSIDSQQQALLQALSPYLSNGRISKLERAMRAARIARMASAFVSSGGLQLLSGR